MGKFSPETIRTALDCPMGQNDADASTVRDYLKELLAAVITKEEGFSGKRPFGNSGWMRELHLPLVKAKLIKGRLDDEGYIASVDEKAAERLLLEAIASL
jgi:hypothetical protein